VIKNYLAIAIKCASPRSVVLVASEQIDDSIKLSVTENSEDWLSAAGTNKTFARFQLPQDRDENSEFRLSLATSKVLIEAHSGTVGAISAPGIGSKFWFSIPAKANANAETTGCEPADAKASAKISLSEILRPGLVRKAVILTAFPLVVQASWLVWVNAQLDESERLEMLEQRHSNIVAMTNRILMSVFRANSGLASFLVKHDTLSKDLAVENFDLLDQQLPQLDALTSANSAQKEVWQNLAEFVRLEIGQLQKTFNTAPDDGSTGLSDMAHVLTRAGDLFARSSEVLADDLRQLAEIQIKQEDFRSRVQTFIFWSIPINLAMSLGLLWLFTVNITKRLNIVIDNARKLPGREMLGDKIRGSDEIASLDALLHEAAEELSKADQLREGMMDIVAHDIRSPLIAVETSLSLLERAVPSDLEEKAVSCLKSIRGNVNRVLRLADDLLTIDNLDENSIELELADCQLRNLAQDAADTIASLAQAKHISIKVDCPDLSINIDERRMMQVLINLLTNALKFSPNESAICIGGRKVKGGLQLFVEDEGKGMDAETAAKIFDKYVTGAQTEKAFGLGLSICKLIVTAHGGTLSVDSQLGRGSTFFILLPQAIKNDESKLPAN
jgi:signal transduction histidine kinase